MHSMIKVNCQLTKKDAIILPVIHNKVEVKSMNSKPMPFSIVSMLLEKGWIRCNCLIKNIIDTHANSSALNWLVGVVSK
jgi:hypothetical protein